MRAQNHALNQPAGVADTAQGVSGLNPKVEPGARELAVLVDTLDSRHPRIGFEDYTLTKEVQEGMALGSKQLDQPAPLDETQCRTKPYLG